jgi:LacI family transcriptional regulator
MRERAELDSPNNAAGGSADSAARRAERRRVRMCDVARSAGVSAMTVSRVVNGTGSVNPATRDYVQRVIRTLGYAPDSAARSLTLARPERIAVVHGGSRTADLSRLLIGVVEECNRLNVQVVVRCVEPHDPSSWRTVSKLIDDRMLGVILPPPLGDSVCLVDALRAAAMPVVVVSACATFADAMHVGIDDRAAAYEMTQHLLALGHRRVGFIKGPATWSAGEERWHGFAAALSDAGIDAAKIQMARAERTFRSGLEAAKAILDGRNVPTAIFASCDDMAAAVIAVAHHRRLQVPGDLTVVGFDDDLAASAIWPELTTVRQPVSEMALEAVNLLVTAIRSDSSGRPAICRKKVVGHQLVFRASASPPAREPAPSKR